jgi:two-component system sensor histidine kinase YesM
MLPLYGIGFFIYLKGLSNFRGEIEQANVAKVSFMASHFEQEARRMRTLQFSLARDRDLLDLINKWEILSPYERDMLLLRISRTLYSVKNSSRYISDVVAYLGPVGFSVSALGDIEHLGPGFLPEPPLDAAAFSAILSLDGPSPRKSFGSPIANSAIGLGVVGIRIEIVLSRDSLESGLDEFSDYGSCGSFIYDEGAGVFLCGEKNRDRSLGVMGEVSGASWGREAGQRRFSRTGETIVVFAEKSAYLGIIVGRAFLADDAFMKVNDYRAWFIVFSILSLFVILISSATSYEYVQKPISLLSSAFGRLEKGDFGVRIEELPRDDFKLLCAGFNDMAAKLSGLIDEVYTQKILAQESEMRQLQAQINPHFLYNSLFILSTMIKTGDCENAQDFALHLGQYFQYLTKGGQEAVPLADEYAHAASYMSIQRGRMGERVDLAMDPLPEDCYRLKVPRLILQPLLENAFEHGVRGARVGVVVRVSFESELQVLKIRVEDSGVGISDCDIERLNRIVAGDLPGDESIGILNIHRRIEIRYGEGSGLAFSRSPYGGLRAELSIRREEAPCIGS